MSVQNTPLLSIIVPVYNVENYIVQCLASLVNQTEKRIEIILIDDGSQDKSGKLCDEFAAKHSEMNIKVIHQENVGLSAARNCGIGVAKAKYITFLDSDDYVSDDFAKLLVNCAESRAADIVICGYYVDNGNKKKSYIPQNQIMSSKTAIEKLCDNSEIKNYAWGKIYCKELFDNIKFPEGRCFEDILTTYKTFLAAKKIVCLDAACYCYRIRENGITGNSKANPVLSYHRCLAYIERYRDLCDKFPSTISVMLRDLFYSIGIFAKSYRKQKTGEYLEIRKFAKDMLDSNIPGLESLDWVQIKELKEICNNGLSSKKLLMLHFIHRFMNKYKKLRSIIKMR